MKKRSSNIEGSEGEELTVSKSIDFKRKNMKKRGNNRSGGRSLDSFANAKSNNNYFNPALIKKKREFYKNAKYVNKYKKSMKEQNQQMDLPAIKSPEDDNGTGDNSVRNKKNWKNSKKKDTFGLKQLYDKKREEEEKARMEREAIIQTQKEEKEKALARRKATREMMLKKNHKGQPVMKYRIEHLLETIQGSSSK